MLWMLLDRGKVGNRCWRRPAAEAMLPELLVAEMQEQVRWQTCKRTCVQGVGVPIPQVAEQLVTCWVVVPVPLVQISKWIYERVVEVAVPRVAELFCARSAEHFVAVPVPLILKENVALLVRNF